MEILVTYDVTTDTAEGRRRLRRVAKVCQAFGQRVQKSVFECTLSTAQLERFKQRLQKAMDEKEDSLRIYHLPEPRKTCVEVLGRGWCTTSMSRWWSEPARTLCAVQRAGVPRKETDVLRQYKPQNHTRYSTDRHKPCSRAQKSMKNGTNPPKNGEPRRRTWL